MYEDKLGITSNPVCVMCTNSVRVSLRVPSVTCVGREDFESFLCLVYEQFTGITSSPVCVLPTNRRRVSLRAQSVSCVRTEDGYHFEPFCVLCANSARVSFRVRSVVCVQTEDVYDTQPCLFVVYEMMMHVTFNPFCTAEPEILFASSAWHLRTLPHLTFIPL